MCYFWPATENVRRSSQVKIVHWLPDPMERLEDGKLIPTRPLGYMGRYKPNVCVCVCGYCVCVCSATLTQRPFVCAREAMRIAKAKIGCRLPTKASCIW